MHRAPYSWYTTMMSLQLMSLTKLKMEAATLGISRPDGHKGLKATWIAAIQAAAAAKSSPDKKKLQVLGDIGNKMQAEELEVLLRDEREARVEMEARAVTAEARAVAAEASVSEEREARIAAEARADAMEIINRDLLEQSGEGKSEDQLKRELLGVGSEVGAWGATVPPRSIVPVVSLFAGGSRMPCPLTLSFTKLPTPASNPSPRTHRSSSSGVHRPARRAAWYVEFIRQAGPGQDLPADRRRHQRPLHGWMYRTDRGFFL